MSGIFTNLWGAILEAWTELRIHKLRVLLSLIGVAVAVTALTTVVALGQIAEQAGKEQNERQGGRPALIYVGAYTVDGSPMDIEALDKAFNDTVDRYSITYASHNGYLNGRVQLPGAGVVDVQGQAIDADFGTMHRVTMLEGSWFTDADNDRLAPAVIINEYFWKQLGSPDLATHPTTVLLGENDVEAVIVGVTPSSVWEEWPTMFMQRPHRRDGGGGRLRQDRPRLRPDGRAAGHPASGGAVSTDHGRVLPGRPEPGGIALRRQHLPFHPGRF